MLSPSSIFAESATPSGPSESAAQTSDLSRCFAGLLALADNATNAAQNVHPDDALSGVICRPTLRLMLSALRSRDPATLRHCRRVAMLAVGLARHLQWEPADQKVLEVAGLLHDVGKIGIPDNILFKPGRLNSDEVKLMNLHHNLGINALQACRADIRVIEFIASSFVPDDDGAGAFRPALSDRHQGARILAVADAYDSLHHDQVFREGKEHGDILKILMKDAGKLYDGNVVCALARWIEREGPPQTGSAGEADNSAAPAANSPEAAEIANITSIFTQLFRFETACDGFFLLDGDLRVVIWSPGAERLLQYSPREILGQVWAPELLGYSGELGQPLAEGELPLQQAVITLQSSAGTVRMRRRDSRSADLEVQSVPVLDQRGNVLGIVESFSDKQRSPALPADYRELKLAASRDALTSVANRAELESQLNLLLDHWRDSDEAEPFSVIFLDVDFFKNINDTFGHTVGDQVLIDVARLMQQESNSGELVARYGGEEFVILCPATLLEQAARRAERLRSTILNAKVGGIGNYRVTASFGVTQIERHDSPESVLSRADAALYQAKESGRNKTCSLSSEQAETAARKNGPEQDAPAGSMVFTGEFPACIAADMIVYKLGGLVRDENAKLTQTGPGSATIQLGSAGLFRTWGASPKKQPVTVRLDFGSHNASNHGKSGAAAHIDVTVRIEPVGRVREEGLFQVRARHVMKLLRSYFVA
ncbi:MAG: diguanylate cyclase [Planctomycetaceae bacterium]